MSAQSPADIAYRARGLARAATEDRKRAEATLETLKAKERQASLDALLAEAQVPEIMPRGVSHA